MRTGSARYEDLCLQVRGGGGVAYVPGFGVPYVPNMIPQIPPQHTTDTPGAGCAGDTNVPQRENAHIHTAATVHTGRVTTLEVRLWVDA
eukprot:258302-Prymnesium_polylepis.1